MENSVQEKFKLLFGKKPDLVVTSPGRINLIGEHTDYNGGWVLPAAIDKKITFALGSRTDLVCRLHSIDFNDTEIIDLANFKSTNKSWVNYLLGVIEQFQNSRDVACNVSEFTRDVTCNVSEFTRDVACNVSEFTKDVACNVSEFTKDVASNVSEFTKDVTCNVSEFKRDVASNVSEFTRDVACNASEFTKDVASNVSEFKRDVASNVSTLPHGFNLVFGGDVPLGAGLSSSAALEAGLAFAINEMFQLGNPRMELVKLAQRAENEFVGVRCGIMDMFASIMGKEGSVMRLDCRSLEFEYFPFNFPDIKIVLCDSGVKHSLGDGEYNIRRAQCEEGVAILKKYYPHISTLRDVSFSLLEKHSSEIPPIVFKRCRYIVNEIARVESACSDLAEHNLIEFGKKMFETHIGLSEDFGVSCEELDFLVALCALFVDSSEYQRTMNNEQRTTKSVYGARMMGGGFGGCTINLVRTEAIPEFIEFMRKAYLEKFNLELKTYVVTISDGTQIIRN